MNHLIAPDILRDLAPTGLLRAAINLGNPVLAQTDAVSGEPRGTSVDLAQALAQRLGVALKTQTFDGAGKVFAAAESGQWDVAFLAIDPLRAEQILFTAPYVIIEGTYLVRNSSALRQIEDFDQPGVRIAVGRGAAYDLYLTRALKHAQLVRAETSVAAIDLFDTDALEAVAGVRQPLEAAVLARPDWRVVPGRFTAIEQAMGTPRGREAGRQYLRGFIEEMKASGFVVQALARSGQQAGIAPAAPL